MFIPLKFLKNLSIKNFSPLLLSLIFIGIIAIAVSAIKKTGYHITYSVTASMPKGFYLVMPTKKISRYDIVEFIPPVSVLNFIKEKLWVPKSGLIIKYVFAVPGDHVCIQNESLLINHRKIGRVYKYYDENKLLPQIKICGKLSIDQYLLLSTKKERSFDGRYFGTVSSQRILGRALPIFIFGTD